MTFWVVYAIRVLIGDSTSAWLQMLIRIVKQVTPTRKQSAWLNVSSSTSSTDWMWSSSRKKSGFSPFVWAAKKTCWSKKKQKQKQKNYDILWEIIFYFIAAFEILFIQMRIYFKREIFLRRIYCIYMSVAFFFFKAWVQYHWTFTEILSLSFYNCVRMFVF